MTLVRMATLVAMVGLLAACDFFGDSAPRFPNPDILPTTFKATIGSMEQTVTVNHPSIAPDEARIIGIESVVTNRGLQSVRIVTRTCALQAEDLTADNVTFISLAPGCDRIVDTLDLQPGQSTPRVESSFRIEAPAGELRIRVRQLLSPLSYTEIRTRIANR